jgi:enamine deaminase RidA (YjgF/YER057c/UK114 family)
MKRLHQNTRRSRAIIVNNMVYLSGQYADDTDVGIAGQTEQILHKIDVLLKEAGTDRSKLVQATIWLKTMDDYDGFNAVWDSWVIPDHTPTRACGEVRMADDDMLVEILAVAAL